MNRERPAMMRRSPVVTAFLLLCTTACTSDSGSDASPYTVRDSAGVRIVENNREVSDSVWRTSDVPVLELGHEASGPDLFGVIGVARLSDGTIAVGNSGAGELIMFDKKGGHTSILGGEGQGPGEFAMMVSLALSPDDTLLTYDQLQYRLSWFDSHGRFVRSAQVPPNPPLSQPTPIGFLDDSTAVVYQGAVHLAAEEPVRIERLPETLYRYILGHAQPESLLTVPGPEIAIIETNAFAKARGINFQRSPREFGRMTGHAVARQRLFIVDNERCEVRAFDGDGKLKQIIRRKRNPIPLTDADVRLLRERDLMNTREGFREMVAQMHTRLPDPPETLPACEPTMLFDSDGRLWVADYHWPPESLYSWSVFDRSGFLAATVRTPFDLRVMAVGRDFVLGVWRDEDDVEYVRQYELVADPGVDRLK